MKPRVYFQTQFVGKDGVQRHSDTCMAEPDRDFFHILLDEWLDNCQEPGQKLSGDYRTELVFRVVNCGHGEEDGN